MFSGRRSPGSLVSTIAMLVVLSGCRPNAASRGPDDGGQNTPTEAAAEPADAAADPPADPAAASPLPRRPLPARPARQAVCGHAVAFAGWRPAAEPSRDAMLLFDPGDNTLEKLGHVWDARAREVPIHYGTRRPTVVLLPAGAFTVTGAVVIAPAGLEPGPIRLEPAVAVGMPDLTQNFDPRWPGLCGPTSAADTLYSMHARGRPVLDGFAVGAGPDGDSAVARLVAGGGNRIAPDSLAGRMGIGADGDGATNEGLRAGCLSWLEEAEPGAWQVELLWFDDEVRDADAQRAFVHHLASALDAGGGAILCLWPGSEFADGEIGEGQDDAAAATDLADAVPPTDRPPGRSFPGTPDTGRPEPRPALPEAEFPDLPPPAAERRPTLPGRPAAAADPATALEQAREKRRAAETRSQRGDLATALALATQGVELLVGPSRGDGACRTELERLLDLCEDIEARLPARKPVRGDRPTVYE